MKAEVRHAESWGLVIENDLDDWPSSLTIRGTRTRTMRPMKIVVRMTRGHDEPGPCEVQGIVPAGTDLQVPRWDRSSYTLLSQAPDWIQELVTKVREQNSLRPGETGVGW